MISRAVGIVRVHLTDHLVSGLALASALVHLGETWFRRELFSILSGFAVYSIARLPALYSSLAVTWHAEGSSTHCTSAVAGAGSLCRAAIWP